MTIRFTVRKALISALIAASCGIMANPVAASDRRVATERFTEYADVIDVQPIYQQVRLREPRQECWTEQQRHVVGYQDVTRHDRYRAQVDSSRHSTGSVIVGSVIGGVIGNQLGRGHSSSSRTGATVAGAIIGGALGSERGNTNARHRRHEQPRHRVESQPVYELREVERCKRVVESRTERKLQHYNVTYRYKGRTFTTQLPRDPGRQLELQVSVAPARR